MGHRNKDRDRLMQLVIPNSHLSTICLTFVSHPILRHVGVNLVVVVL